MVEFFDVFATGCMQFWNYLNRATPIDILDDFVVSEQEQSLVQIL